MKIDLQKIADEPFDWQETLPLSVDELDQPDLVKLSGVQCRGRIRALPPGHLLQANLSYAQTLRCTRCLEPFEMDISGALDLVLEVTASEEVHHESELAEEDLGVVRIREPEFETQPLIVEQVHLGIPMKPLCREECQGICSQCGANLNAGACECKPVLDPRWAALGKLRS